MDRRQPTFILSAWVTAHTGVDFGRHLPQKEVIRLLSDLHSYHASRSGWANADFTHEQVTLRVGEALDRALATAAKESVETAVAIAA